MPAAAQTTVTSAGRTGPTACLDRKEVNAANLPITALSTTQVTFTASQITWDQYVTRLGDVPAPAQATVYRSVRNARTNSLVGRLGSGFNSGGTFAGGSHTRRGLSAKTSYYAEVVVTSAGIPDQVFARRCFMTGGTYTMNVAPGTEGRSSGCFSISEFKGNMDTIQHVRNCWCGRKTTLPLFSSTQDNTDLLNRWGCR